MEEDFLGINKLNSNPNKMMSLTPCKSEHCISVMIQVLFERTVRGKLVLFSPLHSFNCEQV